MTKLNGKIALVTGASSEIGEATAQRLATTGYKLHGTSRRGSRVWSRVCKRNAALNPVDMSTLYTFRSKGYADYPVLSSRKTVGTHSALDVR